MSKDVCFAPQEIGATHSIRSGRSTSFRIVLPTHPPPLPFTKAAWTFTEHARLPRRMANDGSTYESKGILFKTRQTMRGSTEDPFVFTMDTIGWIKVHQPEDFRKARFLVGFLISTCHKPKSLGSYLMVVLAWVAMVRVLKEPHITFGYGWK